MNAKTKKLIGALAAIILLICAYVVSQLLTKDNAAQTIDANSPDFPDMIRLTSLRSVDISRIEIKSTGLILVRNESIWEVATPGKRGVAIEQFSVSGKLWTFSNLTADKIIEENPEDISEYGLDNPAETIVIVMQDGTITELSFGSMTFDRKSYYAMVKGDPQIYIVPVYSTENIFLSLDDIRRRNLLAEFDPYSLTHLIIDNGKTIIDVVANNDENHHVSAFSLFVLNSPFKIPRGTDTDNFGKLIKGIAELRIDEFVNDEPSSLSPYGLDRPGRFVVESPDHRLDLQFGYGRDGKLYAKFPEASGVFTVAGLEEIVNVKPFTVVDKFIQIYNIDHVDDFTLTGEGKTLKAEILRPGGAGSDPVFYLNGRRAADDEFRLFYQNVIGIMAEAEYPGPQGRTAADHANPDSIITVTINFNEPAGAVHSVKFVPFNRDFYTIVQNGVEELMISRNQLRRMLAAVNFIVYEE